MLTDTTPALRRPIRGTWEAIQEELGLDDTILQEAKTRADLRGALIRCFLLGAAHERQFSDAKADAAARAGRASKEGWRL